MPCTIEIAPNGFVVSRSNALGETVTARIEKAGEGHWCVYRSGRSYSSLPGLANAIEEAVKHVECETHDEWLAGIANERSALPVHVRPYWDAVRHWNVVLECEKHRTVIDRAEIARVAGCLQRAEIELADAKAESRRETA